jgi:hypothetical protein
LVALSLPRKRFELLGADALSKAEERHVSVVMTISVATRAERHFFASAQELDRQVLLTHAAIAPPADEGRGYGTAGGAEASEENKKGTYSKEKGASRGERGARAPLGGAWRSLEAAGRDRQLETNAG